MKCTMNMMDKCWITSQGDRTDLNTLSFTSATPDLDYMRIKVDQNTFPANPTPEHPLRHVTVIRFLSDDDLMKLAHTILDYINTKN